ncbi:MAG: tRNA lysidine(34) synthetase TilS, partial [Burkholderiales bacterium]
RAQLTEFADARALTWVEDDSNADLSFDRNFLRQVVLPVIEQRFPAYRSTLARASRNLAEAAELAALLGEQDLAAAVGNGGLVLDKLRSWPVSRRYNAVRCLLQAAGCAPPARELLTEALRQAFEARDDAAMRVDFGEFSLRRYRGELFAVRNVPVPYGWQQPWRGECELQLPTGLGRLRFCRCSGHGLSARRLQNRQVDIAFRDGGERMALSANRPHRELKKLYQDAGIAPWLRERTPLMFVGKQLALVPGLGVAAEFQAAPDEDAWEVQWVQG